MRKRERIEYEFDFLSITNKQKREREIETSNENFAEKKRRMETKDYCDNIELKSTRIKKLHDSMYL
jgi:hypothetical protein